MNPAVALDKSGTAAACAPFIKWAGGKRKLLPTLTRLLACLSDINPDLVAAYEAVRDHAEALLALLRAYARQHSEAYYYATRSDYNARRRGKLERAAQFIYLNKTCFNGLFRVNRKGEFNVPMGRYANPNIADADALLAASARLRHADLRCASFECLLSEARPGDFIYMDPPYEPMSRTANFTAYAQDGFSQTDQARLRDVFRELDRRGAKLMLSNSDVPLIRDLYRGYAIDVVLAPRGVNCDAKNRGPVNELVVRNYASSQPEAA